MFFAQIPPSAFNAPSGDPGLFVRIAIAALVAFAVVFAISRVPTRGRTPLVVTLTFLAGFFWVLQWLWPRAVDRQPGEIPQGAVESVAFLLEDTVPVVNNITNVLSGLLLGLGIYSLVRIHSRRLLKKQEDWPFSLTLLISMVVMAIFGFGNYISRLGDAGPAIEASKGAWTIWNYGQDLLFDGLLQQMEAAMFSLIAFFILSAAYRAFRVRSVEATILLVTALIVMLSLMGAVELIWNDAINGLAGGSDGALVKNFSITEIAGWLRANVQNSSLRALDFGIGVGGLAMALRIWLSLEKQGVN